tara:strand:+ start:1161 stop:1532 length:372 start_codon:yes stop_codon:yes gene_type:complete
MANPLHKYTVAEASNLQVYEDYNWESLDVSGDTVDDPGVTAQYITSSNPAKKVVIYNASETMDDDDIIYIFLNGETAANKGIKLESTVNLPFTIDNMLITNLRVTMADGLTDSSDAFEVLSFH